MSPLTALRVLAAALLLVTMANCDIFLVCNDDSRAFPNCTDTSDGSVGDMGSGGSKDGPTVPPTTERSFEWRAKVPLDNKTKFVGIYANNSVVSLHDFSTTSSPAWRWQQQEIKLLENIETARLNIQTCMSCPLLERVDPINNNFYIAGNVFYVLTGLSNSVFRMQSTEAYTKLDIDLVSSGAHPFAHPNIDVLVVAEKPQRPNLSKTTAILPGGMIGWSVSQLESNPTSFVIGDLDADQGNGDDLILFSGGKVTSVQHQKGLSLDSVALQGAMQNAINSSNRGTETSINAGFIANLNDDMYTDFIFSTPTRISAMSYLGKIQEQGPMFENWTYPLISFNGEIVRSVIAANLTMDNYPELIVETDKAVHFYLNIPKPQ